MKKLMIAAVLAAGVAAAATMYRYRAVTTFTTWKTLEHKQQSETAKLASVAVRYAQPYTGHFCVLARQDGVETLRADVAVNAGTSVVVTFDALWFKSADTVTVSNSVSASASAVLDYTSM